MELTHFGENKKISHVLKVSNVAVMMCPDYPDELNVQLLTLAGAGGVEFSSGWS
jgi:hypothetical protein